MENLFKDINLNDGKNRYVIMSPDHSSSDVEEILKKKYPKSLFERINNDDFKMSSAKGDEVALVHSAHGKHVILMERPTNRIKTDTISESDFHPTFKSSTLNWANRRKYRENDEILRKPAPSYPQYEPPKKDHFLIVKSKTPLDNSSYGGTKVGDDRYAIPITKDDHDKANALAPYHKSYDEGTIISNEDFREQELPKNRKEIMSKVLPGVDVEFESVRKTLHPEPHDHYALLHVPKGAEEDVKKLANVKVSPKGKYYTMIPKSVHEEDTTNKNIIVGDMTGFHEINNMNNPKRHQWAPNYNMDHAITVEKTLSPQDIVNMKKK